MSASSVFRSMASPATSPAPPPPDFPGCVAPPDRERPKRQRNSFVWSAADFGGTAGNPISGSLYFTVTCNLRAGRDQLYQARQRIRRIGQRTRGASRRLFVPGMSAFGPVPHKRKTRHPGWVSNGRTMRDLRLSSSLACCIAACGLAMIPAAKAAINGDVIGGRIPRQLSIPTTDTKFRPKATGARNESTTASSFVICTLPHAKTTGSYKQVEIVFIRSMASAGFFPAPRCPVAGQPG